MHTRRQFLGIAAGAGASLALTPELLHALQQSGGALMQRAIPSTGETLPVIGLGRGNDTVDPAAFRAVLKAFVDNGGRVLDTVHDTEGMGEQLAATAATQLGIQNRIFWSLRGTGPGGLEALKARVEASFVRLKVPRIDLIHMHVSDGPRPLALLNALKKEGRLRYVGLQAGFDHQLAQLEAMMRSEPVDFVGVRYTIDSRKVEEAILPLAQERKIGVLAYFPFGGNVGPGNVVSSSVFRRIGHTPLPAWAADCDAKTWAQFVLKYIVSHPAVTAVRAGTTKPAHLLDNLGGGIGRLPDEATRKRMAAVMDAFPFEVTPQVLQRYAGEYRASSGFTATFRRDGDKLFVKTGSSPEVLLTARSTGRFRDPQGTFYEFQIDGPRVTGVILERVRERMVLERK